MSDRVTESTSNDAPSAVREALQACSSDDLEQLSTSPIRVHCGGNETLVVRLVVLRGAEEGEGSLIATSHLAAIDSIRPRVSMQEAAWPMPTKGRRCPPSMANPQAEDEPAEVFAAALEDAEGLAKANVQPSAVAAELVDGTMAVGSVEAEVEALGNGAAVRPQAPPMQTKVQHLTSMQLRRVLTGRNIEHLASAGQAELVRICIASGVTVVGADEADREGKAGGKERQAAPQGAAVCSDVPPPKPAESPPPSSSLPLADVPLTPPEESPDRSENE